MLHPTSQTVPYGSSPRFSASATGSPFLQWFPGGVVLTNGYVFQMNGVTTADAGPIYCVATNIAGVVTSQVATLSVTTSPPHFVVQPTNKSVYHGGFVRFDASAVGAPLPVHRWYRDGEFVPPNFSGVLTINNATTVNAGSYYCVASNFVGVATSQVATLTVITVPPLVSDLSDRTVEAGVSFGWPFTLTNPPAFLSLVREETGAVVQSNNVTLTFGQFSFFNPQPNQAGRYFIVAGNAFGVSTSRVATVTVFGHPPSVALHVADAARNELPEEPVPEGSDVYFYATTAGTSPLTASLYRGDVLIPLWQANHWRLPAASVTHSGDYTVVVSNAFGVATATVQLTVYRRSPLDQWTLRNPLPQGHNLHGVAWGQGQFVAVGANGTLVTSTNGTNWTAHNTQTVGSWSDVAYGDRRFVAVGNNGAVLVSTNGEQWEPALIGGNPALNTVTFGNGRFLAAGGYVSPSGSPYPTPAAFFQSTNGIHWSAVTVYPPCCYPFSVAKAAFGAGRFLLVNYNAWAASSDDLVSWNFTTAQNILFPTGASFVNDTFIVLGPNGDFNTSLDGNVWSGPLVNPIHTGNLTAAAHGAGRYIIVGSKGRIITSASNLSSWSSAISPSGDRLQDVIFANNLFVAVGEHGTILTSVDGLNWSSQTGRASQDLDALAVGNGLAVAVGKSGTILHSTDGTTWNYSQAPGGASLHGVAYGDGKWVAVGDSTNIFTSTDGWNWNAHWPGFSFSYLKSVLYANNLWVAVGTNGQIITSPDALAWTKRTSPVSHDLNDVIYGNGTFVVVGDNNLQPDATILTSPDGITWQDRSVSVGKNARGIGFANGLNVIALNDGMILYGSNATASSWQPANTGITEDGANLRGVTWSSNLWVAVGNDGIILTSTNAQTWRRRLTPTFENLHAVRYFNNTFIAIGNHGTILQSARLEPAMTFVRASNQLRIFFSSPYEGIYKLQQTENFIWSDLVNLTNETGSAEYIVPLPPGTGQNFFRVIAP